jgi:capsular exopolysaccharide synthesis family protein
LRQLFALLMRRRRIFIATFLFTIAAAMTMTSLQKPIYEATATLLINTDKGGGLGKDLPLELLNSGLGDLSPTQMMETQVELIKSMPVRKAALGRLPQKLRQAVRKGLKVNVQAKPRTALVDVVVLGQDAEGAAQLATAICQEYIDNSRDQNRDQMGLAADYLEKELKSVAGRLGRASNALRDFKQANGLTDLLAQEQTLVSTISQTQADLRTAQAEGAAAQAQLGIYQAAVKGMPERVVSSRTIATSGGASYLNAQLQTLETTRTVLLQDYQPDSAPVRDVERQIAQAKDRLARTALTETPSQTLVLNPARETLLQNIHSLQAQVRAQAARQGAMEQAAAQSRKLLARLPALEARLAQLEAEAATQKQTFALLNEKLQTIRVTQNGQSADARLVLEAETPRGPVSPRMMRSLLTAVMLGLVLAVLLALVVDRLDDRIHSDTEAESLMRLPVLVQIPFVSDVRAVTLVFDGELTERTEANSTLLESYRMLRTNIAFSNVDRQVRVLVVTSSLPSEGKSSSSINLAVAAALSGEDVILVDADLRRPSQQRFFNMENKKGVSSVLSGAMSLDDALQDTKIPGLRVLLTGPLPPNPFKMINSAAARHLVAELRTKAKLIIIDTPPALGLADAQVLASYVDASLIVVSCRDTKRREMERTRDLLSQTGTEVLGLALTKVPVEVGGYYSYMGYYYYQHYSSYLKGGAEEANAEAADHKPALKAGEDKKA